MLRINDLFWTIQGEGFNAGRRALFIRLPFCNYNCSWCDTTFDSYKEYELHEFIEFLNLEKARFAVITGGEPMMNKQTPEIVDILKKAGFEIAVETNGSFPYISGIDWVTCSPKKDVQKGLPKYFINPNLYKHVSEFKYVVDDDFDFSLLERHKNDGYKLHYLSPEFNNFNKNLEKISEYIKENPEWNVSLQTHKWAGWK